MATWHRFQFFIFLFISFSLAHRLDDSRRLVERNDLSYPSRRSFEVKKRADPTPTVDLLSMPSCAQGNCISDTTVQNCSPIPVSCPTSASGAENCVTYSLRCYCNAPTPLRCAFKCSWWNWQLAEDWFTGICPSVKPIDFTGLPSCARDCVADSTFDYGCITATQNCFCSYGSLFGCDLNCKQHDVDKMVSWFMGRCQLPAASATAALNNSAIETARNDGPSPSIKGRPLHWYEIMAIVIAGMTAFALGVGLMFPLIFAPRAKIE